MAFDVADIEKRIDQTRAADIEVGGEEAGISIKRLVDAMEVAKVLAISKQAVPEFMRGEPGICYSAVIRAVRWRIDPFFVAENMFLAKTKGGERIGFMAALVNSVINLATPRVLTEKLRCRYEGEGETLRCIVYGTPKGETTPLEYETPMLGKIIEHLGRNEYGKVKGSPLYDLDPKQQLFYYGTKGFVRKWFPEVLGGVYDPEDMAMMKDVTPEPEPSADKTTALVARLQDKRNKHAKRNRRGFDPEHVNREADKMGGNVIEGDAERVTTTEGEDNGGKKNDGAPAEHGSGVQDGGRNADDHGAGEPDDRGAGERADRAAGDVEGGTSGQEAAGSQGQERKGGEDR